MISFPTITFESILAAIITFMVILGILSIITSNERLYCKMPPWLIAMVSIMAIIRLLYPFDIVWGHEYIYRGIFRNILLTVNTVWDRDVRVLNRVSIVNAVLLFWISGAVIRIIRMILNYRTSMSFIRLYSKEATEEIVSKGCLTEEDLDYIMKHRVKVMKSDRICAPFCCGLFTPTILIPDNKDILEKYSKVILSHEIEHIRRGDLKKKFIMVISRLIYWWFPLFDIICGYISLAMEMEIDRRMSSISKIEYMDSIVDIMQIMEDRQDKLKEQAFLHPVSLFSKESDMKKRFKKMICNNSKSMIVPGMTIMISVCVFILSFLFCFHAKRSYEEQTEAGAMDVYYYTSATNTKIIALDNGKYEIHIMIGGGKEFSFVQDNLFGLPSDVPIYNEKGGIIKWPFFHSLR